MHKALVWFVLECVELEFSELNFIMSVAIEMR